MFTRARSIVALQALIAIACSDASAPSSAAQPTAEEPPTVRVDPNDQNGPETGPEERAAVETADRQRRERVRRLFGELMEPVTEAVEAYEEHDALEESTWFGRDKEDNQERIDGLLDDAIEVLGVSEIATTRSELRRLEGEITELERQLIADREARVGAQAQKDLNKLQQALKTSREEYEERIKVAEQGIDEKRAQILDLQTEFVIQMRAIGVELDLASAQSLLSTVTGDDFVEMCVVFDNVRGVTVQLQELTEESGESLDAAKRYYGSYVVLIRLLDRLQKEFVRRARDEMIPRLEQYAADARRIIEQAEENMARGGDRTIGTQNIRSNQLTIQATQLYVEYLHGQAAEVQARNDRLQVDLSDAKNTYDTVALSSEVAALLREGSRNFAALLRLDLPSLRGFENSELKAEFERLTQKMIRLD